MTEAEIDARYEELVAMSRRAEDAPLVVAARAAGLDPTIPHGFLAKFFVAQEVLIAEVGQDAAADAFLRRHRREQDAKVSNSAKHSRGL